MCCERINFCLNNEIGRPAKQQYISNGILHIASWCMVLSETWKGPASVIVINTIFREKMRGNISLMLTLTAGLRLHQGSKEPWSPACAPQGAWVCARNPQGARAAQTSQNGTHWGKAQQQSVPGKQHSSYIVEHTSGLEWFLQLPAPN